MKTTYKTSIITNPVMEKMLQWVQNCQEFIDDDEGVFKNMEELSRQLEFWRSKITDKETGDVKVMLYSDQSILVTNERLGEYIQVDKINQVKHA